MTVTTLLLFISLRMFAPEINVINIPVGVKIEPFKALLYATGIVESNNNNLALNEKEGAYGRLQLRAIRLRDYEMRTGIKYTLADCYDVKVSQEIFLYYASQIGFDEERICREWNGGPRGMLKENTKEYYLKIQKVLLSL